MSEILNEPQCEKWGRLTPVQRDKVAALSQRWLRIGARGVDALSSRTFRALKFAGFADYSPDTGKAMPTVAGLVLVQTMLGGKP